MVSYKSSQAAGRAGKLSLLSAVRWGRGCNAPSPHGPAGLWGTLKEMHPHSPLLQTLVRVVHGAKARLALSLSPFGPWGFLATRPFSHSSSRARWHNIHLLSLVPTPTAPSSIHRSALLFCYSDTQTRMVFAHPPVPPSHAQNRRWPHETGGEGRLQWDLSSTPDLA